jgi:hypothetical protein
VTERQITPPLVQVHENRIRIVDAQIHEPVPIHLRDEAFRKEQQEAYLKAIRVGGL